MSVVEQAGDARTMRVRAAVREILLVAALFLAYQGGRMLATGHVAEAMANAGRVWDLERAVRLPAETLVQGLVIDHRLLVRVANCYYAYVHFPATAIALIWMYLRRPELYRWMRRTLAFLTTVALVVHLLVPLAPPRMTVAGLIDTGQRFGPSVYGPPSTDSMANQYAAMPSLHVGWAFAVAITLVAATRGRWRWLWLAHPLTTLFVVVATGNHYWLDAIVAIALLTAVILILPRPVTAPPAFIPAQRVPVEPAAIL